MSGKSQSGQWEEWQLDCDDPSEPWDSLSKTRNQSERQGSFTKQGSCETRRKNARGRSWTGFWNSVDWLVCWYGGPAQSPRWEPQKWCHERAQQLHPPLLQLRAWWCNEKGCESMDRAPQCSTGPWKTPSSEWDSVKQGLTALSYSLLHHSLRLITSCAWFTCWFRCWSVTGIRKDQWRKEKGPWELWNLIF